MGGWQGGLGVWESEGLRVGWNLYRIMNGEALRHSPAQLIGPTDITTPDSFGQKPGFITISFSGKNAKSVQNAKSIRLCAKIIKQKLEKVCKYFKKIFDTTSGTEMSQSFKPKCQKGS